MHPLAEDATVLPCRRDLHHISLLLLRFFSSPVFMHLEVSAFALQVKPS